MTARITWFTRTLVPCSLLSVAAAQFGPQVDLGSGVGATDLSLIDDDGDGDLDVIVGEQFAGGLLRMENLGNQVFAAPVGLPLPSASSFLEARGLSLGDLDGDGLLDVVATSVSTDFVAWWPSNGDGTYSAPNALDPSLNGAADTAIADADGDGDMDVVACGVFGSVLRYYENLGGGVFAPGVELATSIGGPLGVAFGLVDGDGVPDLVICSAGSCTVTWHQGQGGGSFGPQVLIANLAGAVRCAIVDLDSDGTNDVVATGFNSNTVVWYRNVGSTMEPARVIDPACDGPFGLSVGDVDFDGDIDVVAAISVTNESRYYENLGSGNFAPPVSVAGLKELNWDVELGDIDGDSDLDLIASATTTGVVALNENELSIGVTYCTSPPNSTGDSGVLVATGSSVAADNDVTLRASLLPANALGLFLTSRTQGPPVMPANSQGVICLAGAIGRYVGAGEVQSTGMFGVVELAIDTTRMPQPMGFEPALSGSTWSFQAWHRDAVNGQATSNFTQALGVSFL